MKKPAGRQRREEPHVEEPTAQRGPLFEAPIEPAPQEMSLAVQLSQAEIEQQVKIAISHKRSIEQVSRNMEGLVALDPLTAEECIYALPRAGKTIRGPSIRFAEIIFSQYRNCRSAARVMHVDRVERFVEAEGVFWDLETGTQTVMRTQRSIQDSLGRIYNQDMIVMTGNAACAVARRNAIIAGIPKAIWRAAYDRADGVIRGSTQTLVERREKAIKSFMTMGVTPERLFTALGVGGERDITLDDLQHLTEMRTAIRTNEASLEELFPEVKEKQTAPPPKGTREKLEALGNSGASGPVRREQAPDETAGGEGGSAPPAATSPTGAGEDAPLPTPPAQGGDWPVRDGEDDGDME